MLPTIVAFNHQYLSISSLLLLRNTPNTFAFIPILLICLSSRNRSISKVFRHIMPCLAQVYKGMIYSKTGVPWQMNNTRILIKTPFKMRCPAAICSDLRGVNSSLCIGHFCTKNAKLSKILQDVYSKRSRNGVELLNNYYSSSIISSTLSEPQTGHFSGIFLAWS